MLKQNKELMRKIKEFWEEGDGWWWVYCIIVGVLIGLGLRIAFHGGL